MFRIGIIGIGGIGSAHVNHFLEGEIPHAGITALCDIDPKHLYRFKDKLDSNTQYFESASALIHSGTVDGVIIATPHYDHPPIAIEAFQAGLHVLCEKPAGVYTKNVRQMNEAAEKSGKAFQINFTLRTYEAYKKIKELLDHQEIGNLKRIVWLITTWYRTQAYYNSGGWRATWAGEGGGTLINQNPHQLDLMQWFAGMPDRVWSSCYFGKNRDIEVEDEVTAYFEYPNGAVGLYMTSVSEFPGTNRLEIAGDRGKLVYEDGRITLYKTEISEPEYNQEGSHKSGPIPMNVTTFEIPDGDAGVGRVEIINNWIDAALNNAPLIAPGYEGIKSLEITNALYLSSWNQEWVTLPIDEDTYYEKLQEKIKNSSFTNLQTLG